ncbi:MAG TPA: hypothetical protein VMS94_04735 [Acidobacteriota bacterium]|nr:hypothetical protein [Acidobacteriota bacterium]
MPKKPKWYESVWKVIGVLAVIFGLLASALQIFGAIDFWNLLIVPSYDFLTSSVSIYYFALFIVVLLVLTYLFLRFRGRGNILDEDYGRGLAELCETPRTTSYIRDKYEGWVSRSDYSGGPTFDYYIKQLQKQGYLKYRNGKWEVTEKALEYIDKYHGD